MPIAEEPGGGLVEGDGVFELGLEGAGLIQGDVAGFEIDFSEGGFLLGFQHGKVPLRDVGDLLVIRDVDALFVRGVAGGEDVLTKVPRGVAPVHQAKQGGHHVDLTAQTVIRARLDELGIPDDAGDVILGDI